MQPTDHRSTEAEYLQIESIQWHWMAKITTQKTNSITGSTRTVVFNCKAEIWKPVWELLISVKIWWVFFLTILLILHAQNDLWGTVVSGYYIGGHHEVCASCPCKTEVKDFQSAIRLHNNVAGLQILKRKTTKVLYREKNPHSLEKNCQEMLGNVPQSLHLSDFTQRKCRQWNAQKKMNRELGSSISGSTDSSQWVKCEKSWKHRITAACLEVSSSRAFISNNSKYGSGTYKAASEWAIKHQKECQKSCLHQLSSKVEEDSWFGPCFP